MSTNLNSNERKKGLVDKQILAELASFLSVLEIPKLPLSLILSKKTLAFV